MKKKGIAFALSLALGIASIQGCIGTFGLTGKLYNFNKGIGNKWINELVFFVLIVVPVYEIALVVDALIFNSLEFWTGSNPVSMHPGEKEVQYVKNEGKIYKIEATQNRFHIVQVDGPEKGETADLVFNPETNTWLAGKGNELKKVVQYVGQSEQVRIFKPSGEFVTVRSDATADEIYSELGIVK
ncbi:MAG TPA: DUF3332 domain-containing protein [Spirochaetota bacterium]|nr:DUF3332 domain-containing protein [Spirochaetota bacterium]